MPIILPGTFGTHTLQSSIANATQISSSFLSLKEADKPEPEEIVKNKEK